jgi:hypothetical protein
MSAVIYVAECHHKLTHRPRCERAAPITPDEACVLAMAELRRCGLTEAVAR